MGKSSLVGGARLGQWGELRAACLPHITWGGVEPASPLSLLHLLLMGPRGTSATVVL